MSLDATLTADEAIQEAKAVIRRHEAFAEAGDLDGVLTNVADDVVLFTNGAPMVEGRNAFREFYAAVFQSSRVQFTHHYSGADVVGDGVVLHGVARGTLTSHGGAPSAFANNFILVLRRQPDGRLRVWRAAFAPTGE